MNPKSQWSLFHVGLRTGASAAVLLAMIIVLALSQNKAAAELRETTNFVCAYLLLFFPGALSLVLALFISEPLLNSLIIKTSLSLRLNEADEYRRERMGFIRGLALGLIWVLLSQIPGRFSDDLYLTVIYAQIAGVAVMMTGLIISRALSPSLPVRQPAPLISPQPPLEPLRAEPACLDEASELIRLQADRPESWVDFWPDDQEIIEIRDRLSRLFKYHCGFEAESFLPHDQIAAIFQVGYEKKDASQFWTLWPSIDLVFGTDLNDSKGYGWDKLLYLEFIDFIRVHRKPGQTERADAYQARPLRLPEAYYQPDSALKKLKRRIPVLGEDVLLASSLKLQQARRSPYWAEMWKGDASLEDVRDQVNPIIADKLGWFDEAFLPEDRLEALFHSDKGLRAMTGAIEAVNQECRARLSLEAVISGAFSYRQLLISLKDKRLLA